VQLQLDAKRSPGALKYLFTELLCAKCGGPEVMTAPSLPETRLLCSSKELFQLIRCAEEARSFPPPLTSHDPHSASPEARGGLTRGPLPWQASDHLRVGSYRTELMQLVFAQREMLLDPQRTVTDDPHGYKDAIDRLSRQTNVPMAYVPGGGAVFFAGRIAAAARTQVIPTAIDPRSRPRGGRHDALWQRDAHAAGPVLGGAAAARLPSAAQQRQDAASIQRPCRRPDARRMPSQLLGAAVWTLEGPPAA